MPFLNILTVWVRESRAFSLLKYNLRSSMNSRWFIVPPVGNSYPGLAVLRMCVRGMRGATKSNGDSASPWKIPLVIGTSPSVSEPQVSSTLQDFVVFPKKFTTFFVMPITFKLSITQDLGPSHKLSDNRSIPLLSSSFFVSLPAEASYLCINGPQYPLTFFCILSALLVVSHHSQ